MKRILVAVVAYAALGAWGQSAPRESGTVLSSQGGRYVFGQISPARRDQYMLDTQTGRLWQIVTSTYKRDDGSEGSFEMLQTISYDQKGLFTTPQPLTGTSK
jgi:hypothetical protein